MQNISLTDIPETGRTIYLSGASNAPAGADTYLIDKGNFHPSYFEIVEGACKNVPGLHFSGVDIIIEDITKPAAKENYWLLELNVSPATSGFYYPWKGRPVDVAGLLLDYLAQERDFS